MTLTKPCIISLLLVTTLVPMVIAVGGWPDSWAVLWATLGGYLMAGGANATNMFMDRDIDAMMARTSLRPIPSGRMSSAHVLGFGITLAAVAFAIFWFLLNPLSAMLALAGVSLLRLHLHALAGSAPRRRTSSLAARPAPSRRWWGGRRLPARSR